MKIPVGVATGTESCIVRWGCCMYIAQSRVDHQPTCQPLPTYQLTHSTCIPSYQSPYLPTYITISTYIPTFPYLSTHSTYLRVLPVSLPAYSSIRSTCLLTFLPTIPACSETLHDRVDGWWKPHHAHQDLISPDQLCTLCNISYTMSTRDIRRMNVALPLSLKLYLYLLYFHSFFFFCP